MGLFNRLSNWLVSWLFNSVPEPIPPQGPAPAPPFTPSAVEQNLLILHNEARKDRGKQPLTLNPYLNKAAGDYALLMAQARRMGHSVDGSTFSARAQRAGYKNPAAENVAMGYATTQSVFDGWMGSSGHRTNILGQYRDVGFGRAQDAYGVNYWCAVFGWGSQSVSTIILENEPLVDPNLRVISREITVPFSLKPVRVYEHIPDRTQS